MLHFGKSPETFRYTFYLINVRKYWRTLSLLRSYCLSHNLHTRGLVMSRAFWIFLVAYCIVNFAVFVSLWIHLWRHSGTIPGKDLLNIFWWSCTTYNFYTKTIKHFHLELSSNMFEDLFLWRLFDLPTWFTKKNVFSHRNSYMYLDVAII